jgi:hypothetical protein
MLPQHVRDGDHSDARQKRAIDTIQSELAGSGSGYFMQTVSLAISTIWRLHMAASD